MAAFTNPNVFQKQGFCMRFKDTVFKKKYSILTECYLNIK